jgi:Skp family chaperone for outer membrane proteins
MSSLDNVPTGSGDNPDLQAMHRDLVALVRRLEESIDTAPDAAAITAISEQMAEVNARVTSTGRVLLAAETEEIARHAKAVSDAIPAIEKEIEHLQDCERMVRRVLSV